MSTKQAQNPLILRCHRLMEAFAKSDDERDFYLDRQEGFIVYCDLNMSKEELDALYGEVENSERYCLIPKLTFYETKKIMEGFVNEKVYDIDTKEKLLDIIQSKDARENFLEFIHDHHNELDKWQQFYQERFRIRIIEWLRSQEYHFVFEEDLDMVRQMVEKLKSNLFEPKVPKDLTTARKQLEAKAKTYYSNEALNPRPKRGRPPKQAPKVEIETQVSKDIYSTVPKCAQNFLFTPDIDSAASVSFSARFDSEEDLIANVRSQARTEAYAELESLNEKLSSLRKLSSEWARSKGYSSEKPMPRPPKPRAKPKAPVPPPPPEPKVQETAPPKTTKTAAKATEAKKPAKKPAAKATTRKTPAKKRLAPLRPRRRSTKDTSKE